MKNRKKGLQALKRAFLCFLSVVLIVVSAGCSLPDFLNPSGPENSGTEIINPSDPNTPTNPSEPSAPTDPSEPNTPTNPSDPSNPSTPNESWTNVSLKDYKKFLIVGNSHSQDAFLPLPEILKAEGYSGYTIGTLMLSGSSALNHVDQINNNKTYGFKVSTNNGRYKTQANSTLKNALNYDWDIVFMQNGPFDVAESTNTMASNYRTQVEDYIKANCKNKNVKIAYHLSWIAPACDDHSVIQAQETSEKYKDVLMQTSDYAKYDPTSWKIDYKNLKTQHNKLCDLIANNVLNNSNYITAISTETAIIYANQVLGIGVGKATDWKAKNVNVLYRDEMHMSDNGRVLASYAFFAQYMGVELTEIKLTKLSAEARRQVGAEDLTITAEWKDIILKSANYSLTKTWTKL